ncbi:MAG: hypothetical protein IPK81_00830 [Rhodospirillales bacterium]|nr:MAG: hypothetical protein IPK81_00830 [Rhodospirillales bacterium]
MIPRDAGMGGDVRPGDTVIAASSGRWRATGSGRLNAPSSTSDSAATVVTGAVIEATGNTESIIIGAPDSRSR